jgi:hypothetical protein
MNSCGKPEIRSSEYIPHQITLPVVIPRSVSDEESVAFVEPNKLRIMASLRLGDSLG